MVAAFIFASTELRAKVTLFFTLFALSVVFDWTSVAVFVDSHIMIVEKIQQISRYLLFCFSRLCHTESLEWKNGYTTRFNQVVFPGLSRNYLKLNFNAI